jgi:hypothetical protein
MLLIKRLQPGYGALGNDQYVHLARWSGVIKGNEFGRLNDASDRQGEAEVCECPTDKDATRRRMGNSKDSVGEGFAYPH